MSELARGLLDGKGQMRDLSALAETTARALLDQGIDAGAVDVLGEHLARWAEALEGSSAKADINALREILKDTDVPPQLATVLEPAFTRPLGRAEIAALAVHVVDICEALTFMIFAPELPALSAKADRSGGAARSAGVAKRLRG
jgi:hypothetical protein